MASLWHPTRGASWALVLGSIGDLLDFFRRGALPPYCAPRRVSADATLLGTDRLLLVDSTADAVVITLGPARDYLGHAYAVKLIAGSNNVTLDADGTEEIHTTAGAGTLVWNTTGMTKVIWPTLITAPATFGWAELSA